MKTLVIIIVVIILIVSTEIYLIKNQIDVDFGLAATAGLFVGYLLGKNTPK